jgi:hypothetical protein
MLQGMIAAMDIFFSNIKQTKEETMNFEQLIRHFIVPENSKLLLPFAEVDLTVDSLPT